MKRILFVFALLASIATLSAASPAAGADPIVDQLTALNLKMQLATLHYDRATVAKLMTDDFQFVGNIGLVFSRKAFLDDLADRTFKFERNDPTETVVKHYGEDCALVTGLLRIRATKGKVVIDQRLRYVDLWVKRNGEWLWAFSQTARLKDRKL